MRFGRSRADPTQTAVPAPVVGVTGPIADDGNIPFIDMHGHGFDLLRSMDIGHSLWRTSVAADLDQLGAHQILVVAAYTPADIESSRPLMQRFMTIVLGMGLGPHYGSRALMLGAVGYLDACRDEGEIRGLFGDAVTRVRIRRLRAATASAR